MSVAVKVISEKPVYMSFDRINIMEMMPGEVYEIPDDLYHKRKNLFQKLSDAEVAALAKAAAKEDSAGLKDDLKTAEDEALVVDASATGGLTLDEDVAHALDASPARANDAAPADDSVQSAAVTPQNKTVRKFQSKEDKS